ncbi:MAG TPA: FtsX-like permease family protein, partial [Bacteroidota bacterium]
DGGTEPYASSPRPLGGVVKELSPVVEAVASLTRLNSEAKVGPNNVRMEGFVTDKSFFDVFGFQLTEGSLQSALTAPEAILLSKSTAEKIFGAESPVGKTLTLEEFGDFIVTGVVNSPPGKTHLEFDFLGSSAILPLLEQEEKIFPATTNWKNYYTNYTYVRLKTGHRADELIPVLASIPKTYYGNLELETRDAGYSFEPQQLTHITPGPILSNNLGRAMPEFVLLIIGVLASIGMVAAVFNYAGLTLAKSLSRAKEVGIRKVAGADRKQLIAQFLVESIVVLLLAVIAGETFLRVFLIPGFRGLQMTSGLNLDFSLDATTYLLFFLLALVTGICAGAVPAAVMSGFRPALVLKSMAGIHIFSRVTLRKILLGFQFVLSLVLVIVVITIYRQFSYTQSVDYGFTRQNIISIPLQGNSYEMVAHMVSKYPEVADYTAVSHHMGTWEDSSIDIRLTSDGEKMTVRDYSVDERYLANLELELMAGKNFENDAPGLNKSRVIVNQRFLESFGLGSPTDAVGKTLFLEDNTQVQIAGVLKDFLYKPLVYQLEPVMLRYQPDSWRFILVSTHGNDPDATVASLQKGWKEIDSAHPFEYRFYDVILKEVYNFFADIVVMIGFLAFLALTISLLGLLGMVTFSAESRTKEIGIRKVMGASIRQIVLMFARQELVLLLSASVVAVPVSLYIGGMLLDSFAYKITLGVEIVLSGLFMVFFLAGIVVALRALKSASANPVEALRYE